VSGLADWLRAVRCDRAKGYAVLECCHSSIALSSMSQASEALSLMSLSYIPPSKQQEDELAREFWALAKQAPQLPRSLLSSTTAPVVDNMLKLHCLMNAPILGPALVGDNSSLWFECTAALFLVLDAHTHKNSIKAGVDVAKFHAAQHRLAEALPDFGATTDVFVALLVGLAWCCSMTPEDAEHIQWRARMVAVGKRLLKLQ